MIYHELKAQSKFKPPPFSEFKTEYKIYQEDANNLATKLHDLDLVYLDPPYNQHPYGANYFMLNIIFNNKIDGKISKVSGIPDNWNRSIYNKKTEALDGIRDIVSKLDTKYILISYSNEGFISLKKMNNMLSKFGKVRYRKIKYSVFKGSRNLRARSIHTYEFLFLLKKEK